MSLPNIRVGLGHDTHRLESGGPLRIGGVDIEFESHLAGHSDADVLLHAITDALLGASNLGDIGELFPDTLAENRGRDSGQMLQIAMAKVRAAGWRIINLDCVVLAEKPKLLPHRERIVQRIADLLELHTNQISLKGKTGERTGDIGQGRVIQTICVCLLAGE